MPTFYTVSVAILLSGPCSFALIGHRTLELLPSDWLNLEPLALNLSKIVLLSGPRCDITQRSVPHVETINNADVTQAHSL